MWDSVRLMPLAECSAIWHQPRSLICQPKSQHQQLSSPPQVLVLDVVVR
jgi:hypothetical protein